MKLAILSVVVLLMVVISPVFGEVTIEAVSGSGAPGCENTAEGCFTPSTITVDVGGKVIMSNPDIAAHTFTSGTPADGPDGLFDTGLLMAGNSFEYTAETGGFIEYFCMVHPWMTGIIIVNDDLSEDLFFGFNEFESVAPVEDTTISDLKKEITSLKLENRELKQKITALQDEIVSMAIEFSDALGNLGEWYRSQLL